MRDIPAYQASAEVSVMLGGYKSKQITLNGLVKAVENIAKKYSKTGLLERALEEYDNGNTTEFIDALEAFVSVYPPKVLRDHSGDKATIEETFGGIWIEDTEEFAKFVSAVNKSPFEEDGEGIAYTDNYFYAYYRNINGLPTPYASVYMNEAVSQDVVNAILKKITDEGNRDLRGWFDRIDEGVRNVESENDAISGTDKESSNTSAIGKMGAKLSRKGRYFDNPSLYVKVKRADRGRTVNYSLRELDAPYLDAVERKAIIETAKANGTYLKAPNGKKTNLTPEQWVEVRTKRFKAWFGDWELAELAEYLLSDDVVAILNGNEFAKDGTPLTKKVSGFYEDNYNTKLLKGLGEVILDKRSVKDSTIHGFGKAKTAVFAAVPKIITEGRIIDEQKNWKGRNYDSVTIAAPIRIGGSNYVGIVIVRKGQGTNSNRFYLHEVVLQENLQDESFKTDTKADSHRGDIAKVMQKIFISKENFSKIVDANGEPKIVEHSTWNDDFYTFDINHLGESSGDEGVYGTWDYMFTSVSNLRDGIEIVMSNQEKETPRIKRLLKEGKLAYINKATLPSEFTASAQGDQSTIPSEVSYSESKDTTFSPNMQEERAKCSLRQPIFYSNVEFAKKWGATVGEVTMPDLEENNTM